MELKRCKRSILNNGAAEQILVDVEFLVIDADIVANFVKHFHKKLMFPNYIGIAKEAHDYRRPLIQGESVVFMEDRLSAFAKPFYVR